MASGHITIDTGRAERILRDAGKRIRKSNWRQIARGAAKVLQNDMRSGNSLVPKYQRRKWHTFSRPKDGGYKLWIKSGNLRKSMVMHTFSKSKLMWVGPKYRGVTGKIIGETVASADGFYARMVITNTGNDFMKASMERNRNEVTSRLTSDAEKWLKEISQKSNATT